MDVIGRINTLIWAWAQSLRSAKKLSLFFPFLLFAVLQAIVLTALVLFSIPPLSSILVPLMVRLYGELALHYPQHYMFLPRLFAEANIWLLNPWTSWLSIGSATLMFAAWYRGQSPRFIKSLVQALRRIWPLLVVGLVEWMVVKGLAELFELSATKVLIWGLQSPRLFMLVSLVFHVVLVTPFAYTAAWVVLSERGVWGALRGSFSLARGNFGITYFLFLLPSLPTLLVNFVLGYAPVIVFRFSPQVIILLLGLNIVVTLVVNFVIVGALTALYLHLTEGVR